MKPIYSIIIPAYNEEKLLPRCIESVQTAMRTVPVPGEIIVVDNNSTDNTADVAKRYNVHVVDEPYNQISRARNTGAGEAIGKYLIFFDADSMLPPGLLNAALKILRTDACCGGGALVAMDRPVSSIIGSLVDLWTALARKFNLAAGCFIFCRRDTFDDIGGFNERVYASEELFFSRALRKWGRKHGKPFKLLDHHVVITSARKIDYPVRLVLLTIMGFFMPYLIFSRRLSWFWYKRPK